MPTGALLGGEALHASEYAAIEDAAYPPPGLRYSHTIRGLRDGWFWHHATIDLSEDIEALRTAARLDESELARRIRWQRRRG